ncbi:MAG: pectin acetylesterase-family hydrolase [Myxococcota bacterium]
MSQRLLSYRLSYSAVAATLSLAAFAACGDDAASGPKFEPPAAGTRLTVEPGGDTICSRGTPYRFFAYGGDTKKIVIDFEGGGACWNAQTCSVADAIFAPEAETEAELDAAALDPDIGGIYKLDDPANPVQGWSLIHLPYCTGDVHWGNATHEYNASLTVNHRGFANTMAVLDWTKDRYPDPDVIFITGCSAGAYGAIGYASWVAERWPKADIRVLADSGAGIITDAFFADSFPTGTRCRRCRPTCRPGHGGSRPGCRSTTSTSTTPSGIPRCGGCVRLACRLRQGPDLLLHGHGRQRRLVRSHARDGRHHRRGARQLQQHQAPGRITIPPVRFSPMQARDRAERRPHRLCQLARRIRQWRRSLPSVGCTGDDCRNDSICNACAASGAAAGSICHWCEGWPPAGLSVRARLAVLAAAWMAACSGDAGSVDDTPSRSPPTRMRRSPTPPMRAWSATTTAPSSTTAS